MPLKSEITMNQIPNVFGAWIFEIGYCSKIAVIDEFGATDYDSCTIEGKG
jgi:hypothetical protein